MLVFICTAHPVTISKHFCLKHLQHRYFLCSCSDWWPDYTHYCSSLLRTLLCRIILYKIFCSNLLLFQSYRSHYLLVLQMSWENMDFLLILKFHVIWSHTFNRWILTEKLSYQMIITMRLLSLFLKDQSSDAKTEYHFVEVLYSLCKLRHASVLITVLWLAIASSKMRTFDNWYIEYLGKFCFVTIEVACAMLLLCYHLYISDQHDTPIANVEEVKYSECCNF